MSFNLHSNSMLVLSRDNEDLVLDLKVGQLVAKSRPGKARRFAIKKNNQSIKVDISSGQSEIKIANDKDDSITISPLSGKVKVGLNGNSDTVTSDEKVNIKSTGQIEK
ncbi:MAG: hypothetical protein R2827_02370 [Bdellovibrionales bacterium]